MRVIFVIFLITCP